MVPALGPNAIRSSRSAPPTERQLPPRIAKMWIAYRNCHRLTKEFLGRKSCVSLIERRGMHSKPSLPPLTRKGHSGIRVRRFVECILEEIPVFRVARIGLRERIRVWIVDQWPKAKIVDGSWTPPPVERNETK
jgi:hypothetical protein